MYVEGCYLISIVVYVLLGSYSQCYRYVRHYMENLHSNTRIIYIP